MTHSVPFVSFDGNCREAMQFYQKCFDGELFLMPFSDAPGSFSHSEPKDHILHSTLKNGAGSDILMAADTWSGQSHQPGNNFTVMIQSNNVEEAEQLFAAISEGGKVTMPLQNTFWGRFGALTDQFGIQWTFNCEAKGTHAP
jgi:PhnB protein